MPTTVTLQIDSGPIQGEKFVFEQHDTFIFGRHRDCHAHLTSDPHVSRHHFLLEVNPPAARIRDLGSRNGTRINGTKYGGRAANESPEEAACRTYPEVDLKDADQITVGSTTISVRIERPACCRVCGQEINRQDCPAAEPSADDLICPTCRRQQAVPAPRVTVDDAPACARCGRPFSGELDQESDSESYCHDCRTALLAGGDPLKDLLRGVIRGGRRRLPTLDKYELGEQLGAGGQGVVYKATRKTDQRIVAIKVMLPKMAIEKAARKRFLREIDVMARLRHDHIIPFLDRGTAGPAFYFVMEYCRGGCLGRLLRRRGGRLELSVAAKILKHCLDGLDHMHRAGYVHRDLKPANILLSGAGGRWKAKIGDFGLAKAFAEAGWSGFTATNVMGGTYDFMPREQLTQFRDVRPVSDLWSLAAMFYLMLTGHGPRDFQPGRDRVEVILHDDPIPILRREPAVPKNVAMMVDRALATKPDKRFQSAAEMKQAVCEALQGSSL